VVSEFQNNNLSRTASPFRQIENLTSFPLLISLLILVCIVYYYNTRDVEFRIAYKGYGPQDYVNQKLYPHNFQNNWPSGIMNYDNSLPMKVYYYLAKYCGISPTTTMYPYMFIQTLLFLLSVAFLSQTLFKNKFVTLISVIIIPLSNLAGLNLSRFGAGYGSYLSFPLFYGYANAFRFFSLSFFLKNKHIPCFVFLALSIYCHVNMGLFALAFIGAYVLYKPSLFREKSFIAGVLVFLVMVVPHIFSIISNAAISSGGIPVDQWVKSTRIFCFHWYPITMKLFTKNAHREVFPFLLLCFFFFVALRYHDVRNEKSLKIIVGSIACLIMSLIGIIFSDIYPVPFLIKVSLQRSTGLITFFGVLYIIYYLFRKMNNDSMFAVFLAVYSLLVLAFAKPGIAILPLFLLLYSDIRERQFGPVKTDPHRTNIATSFCHTAGILLVLFTCTSVFKDSLKIANSIFVRLWTPLQYFNPFHGFDFLLRGGGFKVCPIFVYLLIGSALITGAMITLRVAKNRSLTILFVGTFLVLCLSIVWYLARGEYLRWHSRKAMVALDFLDVQKWASGNTAVDALFMVDPGHHYGWRDFSKRSSFGNSREWGFTSLAYTSNQKNYHEGVQRLKEFGVDIERISVDDIRNSEYSPYSVKIRRTIRKTFYAMSPTRLQEICNKYGIDYVVMQKRILQARQKSKLLDKFKIAYENDYYVVFCS